MQPLTRTRALAALTGGAGLALLSAPGRVARACGDDGPALRSAVQLLGARYGIQALVELARPTPSVLRAAVVVETLHAASMVAVAVAVPRARSAALSSAGLAATLVLLTDRARRDLH